MLVIYFLVIFELSNCVFMKKLSVLFLVFCFTSATYAQVAKVDTVRVGKRLFYAPKNALKVDGFQVLYGDIVFAYERAFAYNNSFEVEVGPTISMIGMNRLQFLGSSVIKIPHYGSNVNNPAEQAYGFLMSVGYKKYILDDLPSMNGLFIAPRLKFRNYNNKSNFEVYNPAYTKWYKNNLYQGLFTIDIGMAHFFKSGFGIEYFSSLGITVNKLRYNYYSEKYDDLTGNWNSSVQQNSKSFTNIAFNFGVKLFIGF